MPNVSIFKNISTVENPINMDLLEYLEMTKDGKWEDIVTECRISANTKEFKKTMMTTTLSGEFSYRNDAGLSQHSGYLAMDLDDVENINSVKDRIAKDKYVFSIFVSTSGKGLRVLFKIDGERHKDSFDAISDYLYENYGVLADPSSSVSKPYIVSFDPFLYLNPNSVVFKKYKKKQEIKKIVDFYHTSSDFEMVLNELVGRRINICESYTDYLRVGFSFAQQFGDAGREYFHSVSSVSEKYIPRNTDKQYNYCLRGKGSTKANISTFYYLAKVNGVNIVSEQTKTIVRTTRNGKKAGLSVPQIIENLDKFSSIIGADKLVEDVFNSPNGKDDNEEESIINLLETFISSNYSLKMNEVNGYLEQNGVQLTPSDLNSIFISAKKVLPKLDYNLMLRLLKSEFIESYNPFFKFFNSDGIPVELPAVPVKQSKKFESPLIDLLASTIKNDNPSFTLFFLRKWIVSIISSAHKVHSPLVLVLVGQQLTGKTEFLRMLMPKELRGYYTESKLDKEKDDELLMTENLVIMDDEFGGKSKSDVMKFKNLTSKQWFSLRRPYGDHNEKILRIAVLCGTSNFKDILSDPTGNRRIIPIEVYDVDKDLYNSINKKDLFMEAYRLYKEGFDWRITINDVDYLNKDKSSYEMIIKEAEILKKYFYPGEEDNLITTDLAIELEKLSGQKLSLTILGRELLKQGFVKKTIRDTPTYIVKKWGVKRVGRTPIYVGEQAMREHQPERGGEQPF